MRRRGLNLRKGLLKIILPALRALPPKSASRVLAGIGRLEYSMLKGLRVRYDGAITRHAHHLNCRWDVPAVARELAGNHIRWRTRDLLLDGLPDGLVEPLFRVEGREHLDAALAPGKGVILLGNHFGAHLMPAHWMVRQGYPLRLYMERPRHISRFLTRQFDSDGPLGQRKLFISRKANPAEAAGSILRVARVLKAGMVVNLACDVRWPGPHAIRAKFLGGTHEFSATWITLASLTAAPVVPVFCRMDAEGAYHLEFLPAFQIPPDANTSGNAPDHLQTCLEVIESRIRLDPANSNEYFFWGEDAGHPSIGAV